MIHNPFENVIVFPAVTFSYDENGDPQSLIDIRPMDLMDILDGTIRIYRNKPWVFISLLSVIIGFPVLLSRIVEEGSIRPTILQALELLRNTDVNHQSMEILNVFKATNFLIGLATTGVIILVMIILAPIAQAAVVHAVSETMLGKEPTFKGSFDAIRGKIRDVIIAYFFMILIFTLLLSPFALFVAVSPLIVTNTLAILGFLLIFIFSFIVMLMLSVKLLFIPHAIVLDHKGAFSAFARSFRITGGYWWRIFGFYMVTGLVVGVIGSLLGLLGNVIDLFLNKLPNLNDFVLIATGGIVGTVITLLIQPITLIATTLIYYDLRIRKEGFDLILLSEALSFKRGE